MALKNKYTGMNLTKMYTICRLKPIKRSLKHQQRSKSMKRHTVLECKIQYSKIDHSSQMMNTFNKIPIKITKRIY